MKWYYYQGVKYLRKYYILQIFFNLHIDIEFTPSVKLLLKRKSMWFKQRILNFIFNVLEWKEGKRMKNILVISSSPRRNGNSDLLCDEFIKGALEAGNKVEKVFLAD